MVGPHGDASGFFGCAEHLELEAFVRLGADSAQAIVAAQPGDVRPERRRFNQTGKAADFIVLDANRSTISRTVPDRPYLPARAELDRAVIRAKWTR